MASPEALSTPPSPERESRRPAQPRPAGGRFARRALLWLPVTAAGTLLGLAGALALSLWLWAHSAGSFEQALRWLQLACERDPATFGTLVIQPESDVGGQRLIEGGRLRTLRWQQGGLAVQAGGVELRWPGLLAALLQGHGVVVQQVRIDRLQIDDRRPPQPAQPLTELVLPLPVDLPLHVAELRYGGATPVLARGLQAHYRYRDERHRLQLEHVRWADGDYRGAALLEARAPLALDLSLEGSIRVPPQAGLVPQTLEARARVLGTLAGADAELRVEAEAPQLQASATVKPWQGQPIERADVRLAHFNVAQFWPTAPVTQLTGHLTALPVDTRTGPRWQATTAIVNALPGPWDQGRLPVHRLRAQLERAAGADGRSTWHLASLDAQVAGGDLSGHGEARQGGDGRWLGWDGAIVWDQWHTQALLSRLPAQTARLQARARSQGDATQIELQAQAAQTRLDASGRLDMPTVAFTGQAIAQLPGAHARWAGRLAARTGAGSLALDITHAERLLAWARALLPATRLAALEGWQANGAATAQLQWSGGWQAPEALAVDGRAQVNGLQLSSPQGRLQLDAALAGGRHNGRVQLQAERLDARLTAAAAPEGWREWGLRSSGTVRADWSANALALDASHWQVRPPQGKSPLDLDLEPLHWRPTGDQAGLTTQGQLRGLPLAWLDALPGRPLATAALSTDLLLDARWSLDWPLAGARAPRAQLNLERRSGDLTWALDAATPATPTAITAGVRQLAAQLSLDGDAWQAQAQWDSERAGHAEARLGSRLTRLPNAAPTWPGDAPLTGSVTARLPQMGVWSALAPPGWRVTGTLAAQARLGGTRAAPRLDGSLSADELSARSAVDGIAFTNGRLRASLQGEQVVIDALELEGAGGADSGGRLRASGSAQWVAANGGREPRVNLQVRAEQLRASTRPDRRLTVSGQLEAALAGTQLTLTGDARVDQALFLLPDENTPTLGDDVIVRGRSGAAPAGAARVVPDVNVNLDLGRRFEVRGHGLQARLTGQLNLRSSAGRPAPAVFGEVRTASGSYQAYGQRLDIEEGVLRFTGPYDNPTLDVLAIRPYTTQRVGVQVRGSARVPQVRLYSDPDLPDSEKLAWLVLGRPASGGGAEAAVLQQAALALISGGGGRTLGQRLGLDELSVRGASSTGSDSGTDTGAALTLGKRLSNRLYVSYERSLTSALGTFAMFYDISRRLTLRARAGEDNAVDLIFTVSYD